MDYLEIEKVVGREIIDSRGNPTVEAEVYLADGTVGRGEFPKVKDTIPKSTLTLLPEHAVVRLLGIECQFLVTS